MNLNIDHNFKQVTSGFTPNEQQTIWPLVEWNKIYSLFEDWNQLGFDPSRIRIDYGLMNQTYLHRPLVRLGTTHSLIEEWDQIPPVLELDNKPISTEQPNDIKSQFILDPN